MARRATPTVSGRCMADLSPENQLAEECLRRFASLVGSVGVKRFATDLDLSTRQVNRILGGVQPNPVERLIRALQSARAEEGDRLLDFICQEMGGHFVRHEGLDEAAINAVKECAEAIAAISDGHISDLDLQEIREAISALSGLIMSLRTHRDRPHGDAPGP
jgi:hypothetical protein